MRASENFQNLIPNVTFIINLSCTIFTCLSKQSWRDVLYSQYTQVKSLILSWMLLIWFCNPIFCFVWKPHSLQENLLAVLCFKRKWVFIALTWKHLNGHVSHWILDFVGDMSSIWWLLTMYDIAKMLQHSATGLNYCVVCLMIQCISGKRNWEDQIISCQNWSY